jgi:two-component system, NtrC family, sensor kinase
MMRREGTVCDVEGPPPGDPTFRAATPWTSIEAPGQDLWVATQDDTLRAAEARLEVLSAYVRGIVFEFDPEGRYLSVWTNDPTLLVCPADELIGRTIVEVMGEAQGRPLADAVAQVFATGRQSRSEYALDVQGGRRWFTADPILRRGSPGRPATVTFLVRDVTEDRQFQARLLQAERLASAAMLAAGVGHEIHNPLAYLLLNLERIRSGLRALGDHAPAARFQQLEEAARMALEGAQHVHKVVQDLRMFAPAGEAQTAVDLRAVLDFSVAAVLDRPSPGLIVTTEYGEVPAVRAPEGRLVQVFVNLLTNAVQAMPPGRVAGNEIRLTARTEPTGYALVEVRDNGRGIPEASLARVFDPFFSTKNAGGGTGLGLAICHHIVVLLGGEISVESREGTGTVFRVSLPPAG